MYIRKDESTGTKYSPDQEKLFAGLSPLPGQAKEKARRIFCPGWNHLSYRVELAKIEADGDGLVRAVET